MWSRAADAVGVLIGGPNPGKRVWAVQFAEHLDQLCPGLANDWSSASGVQLVLTFDLGPVGEDAHRASDVECG